MGEKKKPGRFTLQFNLEDPQQRIVSELLEQQGRHKSQFITSAVLRYVQCLNPQEHSGDPPMIDEAMLERMLFTIMEKHPQLAAAAPCEPLGAKEPPILSSPSKKPWEDSIDDEAMKAISETLSAFQQK